MSYSRLHPVPFVVLLLAVLLPSRADAQEEKSVPITFTAYTKVEARNGYDWCSWFAVGSHADPVGNGKDSDYDYPFDTGSQFFDGYMNGTPPEWTGVSEDIPGDRITFASSYWTGGADPGECEFDTEISVPDDANAYYTEPEGENERPTASFSHQPAGTFRTIDFDASGSTDPDGHIVDYSWSFGGAGERGFGERETSYTYSEPGLYTVMLTVTDDDDETSTPFRRDVEVLAPDMRYDVSLEPVDPSTGKIQDEHKILKVGDLVQLRITIENNGDYPLENIRLPGGIESIEIPSGALSSAEHMASADEVIERLEPGATGSLMYLHEAVHVVQDAGVGVSTVQAEAVHPESDAREDVVATAAECDTAEKMQQDNDGCASFSVEGAALIVSLELEPDSNNGTDKLVVGDTLLVRIRVRNNAEEEATDVQPGNAIEIIGLRLISRVEPDRFASLQPGEEGVFTIEYEAAEPGEGTVRLPDMVGWIDGEQVVADVDGEGYCFVIRCVARFPIVADEVILTLKTESQSGEAISVKSGLFYQKGFEIRPMEQIEQGGSLALINFICRSTCADVEVLVRQPEDGEPAVDASVTIGAPALSSPNIITPPAGFFCSRPKGFNESPECGNPLTLRTDDEGKVNAYYTVPGVIDDVSVNITASVQTDGGLENETAQLTIEPNLAVSETRVISMNEAKMLNGTSIAAMASIGLTFVGDACKSMVRSVIESDVPGLSAPRVKDPTINAVVGTTVEFTCTLVPTQPVEAVVGILKRATEIVQLGWFLWRFDLDIPGIVNFVPRPPPQFADFESEFLAAVNDAFLRAVTKAGTIGGKTSVLPGATIDIKLYEMSYLSQTAFSTPLVPALYFIMDITPLGGEKFEYKTLLEGGTYVPEDWLLPSRDQYLNDIVDVAISSGDTQVTTGNGGQSASQGQYAGAMVPGATGEGIAKGSVAKVSATDRDVSAADSDASAAISDASVARTASDEADEFAAGDYIVINPDGATAEYNQIISMDDRTLFLAVPVQHDHAVGEPIIRVSSGTAEPPAPPLLVSPIDSTGRAPLEPVLDWAAYPHSFVNNFDMQLATDSLFTELVFDEEGLVASEYDPGLLEDGQGYYWRVRATNLAGTGAWSSWLHFIVSAGNTGVAVDDGPEPPHTFALDSSYPNPFNPQTTIGYSLEKPGAVRLVVYDVRGRQVARLVDGTLPAGRHQVVFDAGGLPSGVYFYRLDAGEFSQTRSTTLFK